MKQTKKPIRITLSAIAMLLIITIQSFAGQWAEEGTLLRYQQDDGTYATNTWIPAEDGSTWYYADENGTMAVERWIVEDVYNWYWIKPDGRMAQKEWVYDGTDWFYAGESGLMSTGWVEVDGTWYYFFDDYRMAHDTVVDGYTLDSNGIWVQ